MFSFLVKITFFGKSDIAIVKNFLFYAFCCLLFEFCFKSLFLVIFQTFINFRPKLEHETWLVEGGRGGRREANRAMLTQTPERGASMSFAPPPQTLRRPF